MPSTDTTLTPAGTSANQQAAAPAIAAHMKPAIIATRQRCEADGVGLSHYVLMDQRKASA